MKFLFIAPRYHTNQVDIVRNLIENQHRVIFHTIATGATEDYEYLTPEVQSASGLSILIEKILGEGGPNYPRRFPNPYYYFFKLLKISPDYIIIRAPTRLFSIVAAICARLLRIKIIFYEQNIIHKKYSTIRKILYWIILRLFNAAWYSPLLGDKTKYSYCPKYMYYVPFSVSKWNYSTKELDNTIKILMIGKFERRKNHLLLLNALSKLDTRYKLTIVGECVTTTQKEYYLEVMHEIRKLRMQNLVSVEINISYFNIKKFYNSNDLFVLPARDEPASISVLEAMANGLPAICSTTCGTRFYVIDYVTGYIFESDDVNHLAKKLALVLNDPILLENMKHCCLSNYEDNFSGAAFNKALSILLESRWK